MFAMELKAMGSYVSRGLSWKGAEFETYEVVNPRAFKQHIHRIYRRRWRAAWKTL